MNELYRIGMLLIIILSFKTIYKTCRDKKNVIDEKWVKRYVIKRELIRVVLAMLLVIIAYFHYIYGNTYYPDTKWFRIHSIVSLFIIIRSFVHIIFACLGRGLIRIQAEKCISSSTDEGGSDVDTSSPETNLLTDKSEYKFFGYGPSVFMSSNLNSGDTIIKVSFKYSITKYMLLGVSQNLMQSFEKELDNNYKELLPKTKRKLFVSLIIGIILIVSLMPSTSIPNIEKIEEFIRDKYQSIFTENNNEEEINYSEMLDSINNKYEAISSYDKIEEVFVTYDDSKEIPIPYLHDNYIIVTHYESETNSSWDCIDGKKEALIYFEYAKALGAEKVICLTTTADGSKGFSCEIDDVIKGYLEDAWSFSEAEEQIDKDEN